VAGITTLCRADGSGGRPRSPVRHGWRGGTARHRGPV